MGSTPPPAMLARLLQGLGSPGGPGAGPGGPPPGGAPGNLAQIQGLTSSPSPNGEAQALDDAKQALGVAVSRLHMRSPKAAAKLSQAMHLIDEARKEVIALPQQSVAPPPPGLPAGGGFGQSLESAGLPFAA